MGYALHILLKVLFSNGFRKKVKFNNSRLLL